MDNNYRERNQKSFNRLQSIRHITMAILFIAMGLMMFLAEKYQLVQILAFDKLFRYLFGGICFLYGGFRLYRGTNKDY